MEKNGDPIGPVDFVELSFGCTEHDAPICTLVRVQRTGELIHIPGTLTAVKEKP